MNNKVPFTELRDRGYAITSIKELTPGEKIYLVHPHILGLNSSEETTFICEGNSDTTYDIGRSPDDKVFTYEVPFEYSENGIHRSTTYYSAWNLVDHEPEKWKAINFIVPVKALEGVEVDWESTPQWHLADTRLLAMASREKIKPQRFDKKDDSRSWVIRY